MGVLRSCYLFLPSCFWIYRWSAPFDCVFPFPLHRCWVDFFIVSTKLRSILLVLHLDQYKFANMASTAHTKVADGKHADLQKDTVDVNTKQHMTTDYGIKISDPDHWLRVASDSSTGPMLLEDQIAREKVCFHF